MIRQAQKGKQGGFVLVLTLWILVIVTLAATYFGERVTRAVELARQARQNTRALIDLESTRAEILYRLGTTSITEYGLGRGNTTIRLDNHPYRGLGDTLIRLQDTRGLLNLNTADDEKLYRILGLLGIEGEQRGRMVDTLRDFTDTDKLYRLNGAEEQEYLRLNLPPPQNRPLITPWEVRHIIAWRDKPALWQHNRLIELTTTATSLGINPNTASYEVLATLPGITEDIARLIIERRQSAPIPNPGTFAALTSVPEANFDLQLVFLPANTLRITQQAQGVAWGLQYQITLTPRGEDAPWKTDYYTRIGLEEGAVKPDEASELPPRSSAPPTAVPDFLQAH